MTWEAFIYGIRYIQYGVTDGWFGETSHWG
jgi:hypothetical protein